MSIFKNGTVHSAESSGFSVPEILREINFRESRNSKTAIFAILGALNLALTFIDLANFSLQIVQKFICNLHIVRTSSLVTHTYVHSIFLLFF